MEFVFPELPSGAMSPGLDDTLITVIHFYVLQYYLAVVMFSFSGNADKYLHSYLITFPRRKKKQRSPP